MDLEVRNGIEPLHESFADSRVSTSPTNLWVERWESDPLIISFTARRLAVCLQTTSAVTEGLGPSIITLTGCRVTFALHDNRFIDILLDMGHCQLYTHHRATNRKIMFSLKAPMRGFLMVERIVYHIGR